MIYPLLLITIITTLPTLIHARSSVYNLVPSHSTSTGPPPLAVETFCFSNSQQTKPIAAHDCYAAVDALRRVPNVYGDRFWSVPLPGRRFQASWSHMDCSIELMGWTLTAEDTFSLNDVAVLSEEVIQRRVASQWHLGGRTAVGVKEMFQVVVIQKGEIPEVNAVA